ncbi:IdsF [Pectobacterium parmentieri]|uniref:IdsF n=1 Tax=Pectobacterium parmentieri TaxID=1905730 RepID=A0A8B3FGQ7_PECPM|nr:IdsF [Pectobacterium parmentieri]AOR57563.1 IdsF [Pectobacterium parmentieri]AYH17879.1 IdsF [Pectobacterium parmentieri]AYH37684.1 IdsF [Pectobacterium parmentieri]AZS57915.1 IdsF [Pectobacterium parmentieri]RKO77460.1 IdsF [Pectobacterium parmentieri]
MIFSRASYNLPLFLLKMAAFLLLVLVFPAKAEEEIKEKYLFSFKTYKSNCILRVNDLPAADNALVYSKTMSAGFNLTAFLENGNNDIELLMGPQNHKDPKTLYPDSSCQVIVTKDTETTSTEIANFKLTVNEKGEITASDSATAANSSTVFEGYTKNEKDYGFYKVRGSLKAAGLPRWSWVNATPVTENDLQKIKVAYTDIWMMMKDRDIEGLKKITQISNQEMAFAEGSNTGMMFISTDFPQHVIDKQFTPAPIEWNDYKLRTYRGGRLFRLGVGFFQISPLQFNDFHGEAVFSYNPYFSIIDGKVTLVR